MIRFSLRCSQEHAFESWFQSGQAFEALLAAGHVSCPVCGATAVEKSLMAPMVRPARNGDNTATDARSDRPNLAAPEGTPKDPRAQAIAHLKAEIEAKSDYVGMNFVTEARRMHSGEAPERAIYGEAKPEEARKLMEEGIPVAPLPFMPRRKVN